MSYKTIISIEDLIKNLDNEEFIIFDCRCDIKDPKHGIESYTEGHIRNSIFVDIDNDLASKKTLKSGRHPLPDPDLLAQKLSQWGLSNSKQAVVYDDAGGAFASRMWWILKWMGHDKVAVLDGGIHEWNKKGGKLVTEQTIFNRSEFETNINDEMQVDVSEVEDAQYKMDRIIIDARSKERYLGIEDKVDPIAGHVPGAISQPLSNNLVKGGTFKSPSELRLIYSKILGDTSPSTMISMCGSGITACHNILAMEIAGLKGTTLFVGSWSEWITDSSRPIAKIDS